MKGKVIEEFECGGEMSIVTVETTITAKYLRNKVKDEVIDHVMRLFKENDQLVARIAELEKALDSVNALAGEWWLIRNDLLQEVGRASQDKDIARSVVLSEKVNSIQACIDDLQRILDASNYLKAKQESSW